MASGSVWARLRTSPFISRLSPPSFVRQTARGLFWTASWFPVFIFIRNNVAELTLVTGPSMAPYFNENYNQTLKRDVCLNSRWRAGEDLRRGMIITFDNPLKPETGDTIKRIVGLPGDVVQTRAPCLERLVRVPKMHIWVEGDGGSELSQDSNTYGPISMHLVTGKVTHILLPLEKAGRVRWWEHPERKGVLKAPRVVNEGTGDDQ